MFSLSRRVFGTQLRRNFSKTHLSRNNAQAAVAVTPQYVDAPSWVLNRLDEFYDAVLAEDLMILSYNHSYVNPESPYRKIILEENERENEEFRDYVDLKRREASEMAKEKGMVKSKKSIKTKVKDNNNYTEYLRLLDPLPPSQEEVSSQPSAYDRIPRLREISIRMLMPEAVTHSKKVLLNGLLALQMITGQHASVIKAESVDSELKARKGMPIGVSVSLKDDMQMYNFLEKLVELVMPRLRDFEGFSFHLGNIDGSITFKFDPEVWQAFPEIETCYLKFPQQGTVGSLPEFEITVKSSSNDFNMTRLLLSGFRIPFTYREPVDTNYIVEETTENLIHDV